MVPANRFRFLSAAIAIGLLLHAVPAPAAAALFPDMEQKWFRYRAAVEYLVEKGVLQGYPDGMFRPDQPINRAEFLKIVFKGRSDMQPVGRRCFSDVNPEEWYAPYVCAAQRRGIVQGYPNGTFKPGQSVNTAEAMKIVLNAYQATVQEGQGERWYQPYVDYLDENNIFGEHSYVPWEELSRLRAADLLWRLLRFEEEGVVPRYAQGCGKAMSTAPSVVAVGGEERSFLIHIPSSYENLQPIPLLVAFHGRTNSNEQVREYYKFDREAGDAIIVYPAARSNGNGSFLYGEQEVAMFDAIVELIERLYCIDMDRIFVAGHSLGGWFSNKIACIRGDVVRASASLGSSGYIGACTGPAAAMILHNPDDNLAPFGGSVTVRDQRLAINHCAATTHPVTASSLNCVEYEGCSVNPVWFCPHEVDEDHRGVYYPHNWPRGTGEEMWSFFQLLR